MASLSLEALTPAICGRAAAEWAWARLCEVRVGGGGKWAVDSSPTNQDRGRAGGCDQRSLAHFTRKPMSINDETGSCDQSEPGESDPYDALMEAEDLAPDVGDGGPRMPSAIDLGSATLRQVDRHLERRVFTLLTDAARSLLTTLNFGALLDEILRVSVRALEAERGAILLGKDADELLVPAAAVGLDPEELRGLSGLSRTLLRRTLSGERVLLEDATVELALLDAPSVHSQKLRSVLCVPLRSRGDLVGAIYLDHRTRTRAFSLGGLTFLEAFAELAGSALEQARAHEQLLRENENLRQQLLGASPLDLIVTADASMLALLRRAELVARVDVPVMLVGESGTGKELFARALHYCSPRSQRPFVAQNCAAVPLDLMESLFFGHAKGAFTGAQRESSGLFRIADQGTLFLDEVVDLAMPLQAKFLRVLETGVVRPLGSDSEASVNVRVIAAASRPLSAAVSAGKFREDLFYRVNVVELRIPPLRERREDIPLLVEHFSKLHQPDADRRARFDQSAHQFLAGLPWRGNVRELENFVRRALIFFSGRRVTDREARELAVEAGALSALAHTDPLEGAPTAPAGQRAPKSDFATLDERERAAILEALRITGGNRTRAASLLGQHRNALLRSVKRLGIKNSEIVSEEPHPKHGGGSVGGDRG